MEIEALLAWAYRDELPKAAALGGERIIAAAKTGWGGVERYGELLAVVDEPDIRNRFGLFPDRFADSDPHPDAVLVHEAVERLARCTFAVLEGWDPLADMPGLGVDGLVAVARGIGLLTVTLPTGAVALRRSPARLVIRHAILGGCPDWAGEMPVRREVTKPNGAPAWFRRMRMVSEGAFGPSAYEVEVDGFDYKRRLPMPDAYRKSVLDPDPAPVVQGRAEYEIWRVAIDMLVEDLAGTLSAHEALPSPRVARPWETPETGRRILPSLIGPLVSLPAPRARRKKKVLAPA